MKGKKSVFILILAMLLCLTVGLCACNEVSDKNPYDVIQDAYGDDEFVISFNSEGLDEPVTDVSYSANNMPVLPIPTRVGYIFEGWYLDSEYTIPYIDGILYLYMRDVTMYAKWSPVSFEIDGTYDIEFQAAIVEGSVKKGALTDEYGGYADFSEAIIAEETYFEKSGGRLYPPDRRRKYLGSLSDRTSARFLECDVSWRTGFLPNALCQRRPIPRIEGTG